MSLKVRSILTSTGASRDTILPSSYVYLLIHENWSQYRKMRLLLLAQFGMKGEKLVKVAVLSFSRLLFTLHLEILPFSSSLALALFSDALISRSVPNTFAHASLTPEVLYLYPVTYICENVTFVWCPYQIYSP